MAVHEWVIAPLLDESEVRFARAMMHSSIAWRLDEPWVIVNLGLCQLDQLLKFGDLEFEKPDCVPGPVEPIDMKGMVLE